MAGSESESNILPPALLLLTAVIGFILANSPLADQYFSVLQQPISFSVASYSLFNKSVLLFINDGLMAIFFLFVGLELKRELLVGELSSREKASLPFFAAVGGMALPALIYAMFNIGGPGTSGWGIPMATDIAFALGVCAVLGTRVPIALKVMLTAIAIVDDLGAIMVIALFYTAKLNITALLISGIFFIILLFINRSGVMRISIYLLLGIPLWYFMLKSGVHATIAGVLLAFTIPLGDRDKELRSLVSDIFDVTKRATYLDSPAIFVEKSLYKWVSFAIIPIFAFANAGVRLGETSITPITLGIVFGLIVGKPLGIFGVGWLAVKLGLAKFPSNTSNRDSIGIGCLAGIGFTMSLFINSLAFTDQDLANEAKLAIITASIISAIIGTILLWKPSSKM